MEIIDIKKNSKNLCEYLDDITDKLVIINLKSSNLFNTICFYHILSKLVITYENVNIKLLVSPDFKFLEELLDNIVVGDVSDYDYNPHDTVMYNLSFDIIEYLNDNENSKNPLSIWNRMEIGLEKFLCRPLKLDFKADEYSDIVGINFGIDNIYKSIITDIKDCGLDYLDILSNNSRVLKRSIDNESKSCITSKGISCIPFGYDLELSKENKLSCVFSPETFDFIKLNSSGINVPDIDNIKIASSVMLNIDYIISLDDDGLRVEFTPSDFNFEVDLLKSSGKKSKIKLGSIKSLKGSSSINTYSKVIEDLKKCKYYIGAEDEYMLLAYLILGEDNCIVLSSNMNILKTFPFFKDVIPIEEYSKGDVATMLEYLHSSGV